MLENIHPPADQGIPPDTELGNEMLPLSKKISIILESWKLILLIPIGAAFTTFGVSYLVTPTFTATTQILPPSQQQNGAVAALLGAAGGISGGVAGALGGLAGLKNPADQWVGLLRSRTISDAIVKRFELKSIYDVKYTIEARDQLAENTKITVQKEGLIRIDVDDHDPNRASQIATSYVDELDKLTQTLALTETSQRRQFFDKQLKDAERNLTLAERSLRASGLDIATMRMNPDASIARLAQAQAVVAAQELKMHTLRGTLTESNPELILAKRELASMTAQLRQVERSQINTPKLDSSDYTEKYRNFKYYEALYELYAKQYEIARIDEASDNTIIQTVDRAEPPELKSRPRRGLLSALMLLISFALTSFAIVWRAEHRPSSVGLKSKPYS
jgi:uncharacterized protein involved in exopolysaccharide biosynthesis